MSRYSLLLVEWEDDADDETMATLTRAVGERMKEKVPGITRVFHELPESVGVGGGPDCKGPLR